MLGLLFFILMIMVFGKLLSLAFKLTWGIFKILLCFVAAPLILIALAFSGFLVFAIVVLVIMGIAGLLIPTV